MSFQILIAEDDELLLASLVSAARRAGFSTDGATDGSTALDMVRESHYDLLVTDIRMPNVDGIQLIEELRKISPDTRFLAITGFASIEYAVSCLRHGASDFLVKPFDQIEFVESITHALDGLEGKCDIIDLECGVEYVLTDREKVVLIWAKDGKSNWEISQILGISESTVKFHFSNIYRKLLVANKAHAVAKAIELELF